MPEPQQSAEEAAYAAVLEELRRGVRDEPLMAKAYAEAGGEDSRARALYLRWRAAKLMPPRAPPDGPGVREAVRRMRRTRWSGQPPGSWSRPRGYDWLIVIAILLALLLFDRDVHQAVMHFVRTTSRP